VCEVAAEHRARRELNVSAVECTNVDNKTNGNTVMNPEIVALRKQIAELEAQVSTHKSVGLSLKRAAKGGISVYGLGRYPVTLYGQSWVKLAEFIPTVQAFIKANPDTLIDARRLVAAEPAPTA
jgi:hypothetical protein